MIVYYISLIPMHIDNLIITQFLGKRIVSINKALLVILFPLTVTPYIY